MFRVWDAKLNTLKSSYVQISYAIFTFFTQNISFFIIFNLPSPPLLSLGFFLFFQQDGSLPSFTLSDGIMHPVDWSLYDVIWAKGCVNTAMSLVLDWSIRLSWRTQKRFVWVWWLEVYSWVTDDHMRYLGLTSDPSYTLWNIFLLSLFGNTFLSPLLHFFLFETGVLAFHLNCWFCLLLMFSDV